MWGVPHGKEGSTDCGVISILGRQASKKGERPTALVHPDPHLLPGTMHPFPGRQAGETSKPRPSASARRQATQICNRTLGRWLTFASLNHRR